MTEREIILEQMLKVLKDIETNTCDKEYLPNNALVEKKLDLIIEPHEKEVDLLKVLTGDQCTCGKNKKKKSKKEKSGKKDKMKNKKEKESKNN